MRVARARTPHGPSFVALADGGRAERYSDAPWSGGTLTGDPISVAEGDLLCPVTPSKIVCVGRNYAAHAKELGNEVPKAPLLFLKPPSSLIGPGDAVVIPPETERVEHEAELGVVIGRRATRVAREAAMSFVFGYTAVCDVTARDVQRADVQFTRGKGMDTFCPVGPWIETDLDPRALSVECFVSGVRRQHGSTRDMVFGVAELVSYASHAMTLEPGDLLVTGTPEGVGPLVAGDALEVRVEGIGALRVSVRALDASR